MHVQLRFVEKRTRAAFLPVSILLPSSPKTESLTQIAIQVSVIPLHGICISGGPLPNPKLLKYSLRFPNQRPKASIILVSRRSGMYFNESRKPARHSGLQTARHLRVRQSDSAGAGQGTLVRLIDWASALEAHRTKKQASTLNLLLANRKCPFALLICSSFSGRPFADTTQSPICDLRPQHRVKELVTEPLPQVQSYRKAPCSYNGVITISGSDGSEHAFPTRQVLIYSS